MTGKREAAKAVTSVCLWACVAVCHAAEPVVSTNAVSREKAIAETLAGIENELAAHGGSWKAWREELQPYYDDTIGYGMETEKYKWPWPAKHDYHFQGQAIWIHNTHNFKDYPDGYRPFESIKKLNDELKLLGIDLIVAIIPAALSIYPDYLYAAVDGEKRLVRAPEDGLVSLVVRELLYDLLKHDVEVIDLFREFIDYRKQHGDDAPLYPPNDSHYNNLGVRVAAASMAERLMRYDFVQKALPDNPYIAEPPGDTKGRKGDQTLLIVKTREGRRFRSDEQSPVLLIGDSHVDKNRRLSAAPGAQLSRYIGMPVAVISGGGLSSEAAVRVATDRHLRKRKVVILHYTERMMLCGSPSRPTRRWPLVELPGAKPQNKKPAVPDFKGFPATAIVEKVSGKPDPKADYPDFIMKLYVKDLKSFLGKVATGDGVLHVLAMKDYKILPTASLKPGDKITVMLTTWHLVQEQYGSTSAGALDDLDLEVTKPLYWAEIR